METKTLTPIQKTEQMLEIAKNIIKTVGKKASLVELKQFADEKTLDSALIFASNLASYGMARMDNNNLSIIIDITPAQRIINLKVLQQEIKALIAGTKYTLKELADSQTFTKELIDICKAPK